MKHIMLKLIAFIALYFGTAGVVIPSTANAHPLQVNGSVQVNLGTPHHYYHRRRRRTVIVAAPVIVHHDNDNRGEHRGHRYQNNDNRGEHKGNDKH